MIHAIVTYVSALDVNSLINGAAGVSALLLVRELKRTVKKHEARIDAQETKTGDHELRLVKLEAA